MMAPELGRFLQADPIGFKGDGSNLYRYCGNDPIDKSDPMGLENPPAVIHGGSFWAMEKFWDSSNTSQMDLNQWMSSIRPQAGVDGGGGDASGGKSVPAESEGRKALPIPNALKQYDVPGVIHNLEEARNRYSEQFPGYPKSGPVIGALRAALKEGRIQPGLPSNFYHGNPMTTINRTIFIDTRVRNLSGAKLSSLLSHEGQHLADRDFNSLFMRERRALMCSTDLDGC
jgi:hypothetical protein